MMVLTKAVTSAGERGVAVGRATVGGVVRPGATAPRSVVTFPMMDSIWFRREESWSAPRPLLIVPASEAEGFHSLWLGTPTNREKGTGSKTY